MQDLNATAACVLGLLHLGPIPGTSRIPGPEAMTGWQLYDTAEKSLSRFWNITRSQVYRELASLERADLVQCMDERGPRASRPYQITDAGRRAFRDWLETWAARQPHEDQMHSPLLLTVFFGDQLSPEILQSVLRAHRPQYERQLEQYRHMLNAPQPSAGFNPPTAVLRRGIAYREMMLRWIDDVLAELATS